MAAIPCANRSVCCDADNESALANFSMEAADPNRFLSGRQYIFDPPLGTKWGALSCSGWCWSTVSQQDADLCALNQQQSCVVTPPDPDPPSDPNNPLPPGGGPNGNQGWQDPDGHPTELFPNQAQTCSGECPDGTPYSYTLPAGSIYAITQELANYKAYGFACKLAVQTSLCILTNSPLISGCPGDTYLAALSASGGKLPITWSIVGGSLPPGLTMSSAGIISGIIDDSASGDYTVTVKATDENGNIRLKNIIIGVCGLLNNSTLSAYTVGNVYSVALFAVSSVGCGTGDQTFTLLGTLPPGLSLGVTTGIISGTPTASASGDYTFSVQVATDVSSCTRSFTIPAATGPTDTPCNLNTAGVGVIGDISNPTIPGAVVVSWGTMPAGGYTITYLDGAMFSADNPCSNFGLGEWKFSQQLYAQWTGGVANIQWINGSLICDAVEAVVVAASKLVRETLDITHNGGTIFISDDFGPATLGAGATSFRLTQNCIFPTLPSQVRIQGFDAALFSTCPGQPADAGPAWDGTFPFTSFNYSCTVLSQVYVWDWDSFFTSINGQLLDSAEVEFINDGSAPTTTGCGWRLTIRLDSDDLWVGYKGIGTDPTGTYALASGCSPGPATLIIESY